ncbi:hypothetical protein OIU84_003533 [Salix udensis]|uniref:4-coumarate--CoA ligase n=1 Tax=Salix udensis TaxID=889485 RepID=A0AAD6P2Q4_9ROSI|nr:hypothetical protein OIU84_003533 [Salix udensis]
MKIVDPETGVSLPRNQPGEICIRGDQIMKGYLNDPEATARTIDNEGNGYTQVAPAELEALLQAHPWISDAAVVGMKDEDAGEIPVAFVIKIRKLSSHRRRNYEVHFKTGDILQENKTSVLRRSHSQSTIRQNLEEKFERKIGRKETCMLHVIQWQSWSGNHGVGGLF